MMLLLRPLLKENTLAKVKVANIGGHFGSLGNVMDLAWHVGSDHSNTTCTSNKEQSEQNKSKTTKQQNNKTNYTKSLVRHDPQRWKMVLIVALGLLLEIWYIGIPIVGPLMEGLNAPKWLIVMVDTFIGVQILTYFLLPLLIYGCKSWLFVPWVESSNGCCSCFQRGCACWVDR
jgi:antibiotic biosynthesis monooxygenase (ABM) superfamily enzyme